MRKMHFLLTVLILGVAGATAGPVQQRIVGGSQATIQQYPSIAGLLYSQFGNYYWQTCAASIITNRAIMTAAQCTFGERNNNFRVRTGSSFASSGGTVYLVSDIINHPLYNQRLTDNDIAIVHTAELIVFSPTVQAAFIPGANYVVGDNQVVWAAGWGATAENGFKEENLHHVQMWTVNQAVCEENYFHVGRTVTDNMLCAGWLGVGGRDQCVGDAGGPLYQANVVIGISSWGHGCGRADYPGVNTMVTRYTAWIQANA